LASYVIFIIILYCEISFECRAYYIMNLGLEAPMSKSK